MKILVGGSHGLIGSALVDRLNEGGHTVIRLTRSWKSEGELLWNPDATQIDPSSLEGFDAVIHLGGETIGERRWTPRVKQRLWDSRTQSSALLAFALSEISYKPKVFICASAVGYYGNRGSEKLTEESPKGEGFLSDLCQSWEDSIQIARDSGIRVVNLRSGMVLSDRGGALARQIPIFRAFAGGKFGSGHQWMSWISLRDEIEAIIHVLNHQEIVGPVNLTSPLPVTNEEFTWELARALNRLALIPAPRWMLTLALGKELTDEVLLTSQYALPKKLMESGFEFKDPDVGELLTEMLNPTPSDENQNSSSENDEKK